MSDRKGTMPVSVVFSQKLSNCKFVLSGTSNNHSNEILTNYTTLPVSSFQIAQINKNLLTTNKIQQSSLLNQPVVRAIAPVRLPTIAKSVTIQPQQKTVVSQQPNIIFSPASPSKIIIQTLAGGSFQKLQRQAIQRPAVSTNRSNTTVNNNNVTKTNPQIFRFVGPNNQIQLDASSTSSSKSTSGISQLNKSKSLSIVNPAQLSKAINPPVVTSQRLILPATSQFQVAMATNQSIFQNMTTLTTMSYGTCNSTSSVNNSSSNVNNNNNNQGFTLVQTPTVITPTNQSVLSDSSEGNSSDNNSVTFKIMSSNDTSRSSRQAIQQQHQQQQQQQQWPILESSLRQRKPCNCTKSQCLKLYCECFANGEFCKDCNCCNCANNLEHEDERTRAVKSCIERNPHAFHPKIGKGGVTRHHNKGCNCKRSGCLKNYCECYEAKILCSKMCRCFGCRNYEESSDRQKLMQLADAAEVRVQQQTAAENKLSMQILGSSPVKHQVLAINGQRPPYTFVTLDVIEAVSSCLIAEADDNQLSDVLQERQILEEFGRCLSQIIEMASKTRASSP